MTLPLATNRPLDAFGSAAAGAATSVTSAAPSGASALLSTTTLSAVGVIVTVPSLPTEAVPPTSKSAVVPANAVNSRC